ncbi:hypothetical protein RHMOL_Rhmol08G0153200 [Rhododendron molle]|uniref:Uncharacterized protein n=1 Tax=Rhododendron molle TaxID=49168 RepID=A0ACC0MQ84_RHOML|nr:hypothetical protein RHMOL_Rhmol08G0153200 [Rhododendron molle]
MEAKESFADFVKRWRAKAALMTDRPSEKDQLRIISRNLQPNYAKHLVLAQASANFETFFDSGMAIEDALQSGILSRGEASNPPKVKPRAYSGNTNALFGGGTYSNVATSGTNATSSNTTNHISDVNQVQTPQNNRPHGQPRSFSAIEASLSSVLEKLVKSGHLKPLDLMPLPKNPPANFKPNLYCAYHQRAGHFTDSCFRLRHNGAFVLTASVSDLSHQSIPAVQLSSASSLNSPYFTAMDPNPSLSLTDRLPFSAPPPEADMRAISWAIADDMDYATPIINEWSALELDGFPQQPEYLPFDQAWYDGWVAGHEAAMVDPLDEFSLYMLFHQAEPVVPKEEYNWDPEPIWQDPVVLDPNPQQGYAISNYLQHYVEDDLVQEEPRVFWRSHLYFQLSLRLGL